MFRNVNPVAGKSRWWLTPSWEVSYAYQVPGRSKRTGIKRLGPICEIATTKRGKLGPQTNLDLIAVRVTREPPNSPAYVFQPHLLKATESFDEATRSRILAGNPKPGVIASKLLPHLSANMQSASKPTSNHRVNVYNV